ncbi:MerR family transcriptional regulator [Streptomyces sp. NBC_00102]|uniref:MerR family transcriptional regulator n=1 Tax=Streptomyces sp. NBC_00102 TaxID=2975652 RepID=UPI002257CF2C|nr:MerR family transcriptional regulator [Streptomyces sp. NBC_00102]MCX5395532.1 MerR family transcriptional regulator [Streptomyces sp. NBC_00102]
MTADIGERTHTIKEAAALTGLPASTLRYYESIGVIAPVARGESSGHRVYTDADMNLLIGIACLAATGMSVGDMRHYVENGRLGPAAAEQQIALLSERAERLAEEARLIRIRRKYVKLKIDYWHAAAGGDEPEAERLAAEARSLVKRLKPAT